MNVNLKLLNVPVLLISSETVQEYSPPSFVLTTGMVKMLLSVLHVCPLGQLHMNMYVGAALLGISVTVQTSVTFVPSVTQEH